MASDHHLSKATVVGLPKKKEKLKPKITAGSIGIEFDHDLTDLKRKDLPGISVNMSFSLENVPVSGDIKYQIAQDLKEMFEAIKKKYE